MLQVRMMVTGVAVGDRNRGCLALLLLASLVDPTYRKGRGT
jgi:hypothetical protein